jgi:hypothetical protein
MKCPAEEDRTVRPSTPHLEHSMHAPKLTTARSGGKTYRYVRFLSLAPPQTAKGKCFPTPDAGLGEISGHANSVVKIG